MSGVLIDLLSRRGKSRSDVVSWSRLGRIFRARGVQDTPELRRVLNIRRTNWRAELEEPDFDFVAGLTSFLKRNGGRMALRPVQAAALAALHNYGGLFAPIRVGAGKTMISLLAARVLEAKRPVLVIPAKLRDKTKRDIRELSLHWIFPTPKILTYEFVGRINGAEAFLELKPDLIVADECHKLKNTSSAVTRRFARFFKETPVPAVFMSGTITSKSILDYAHILRWCQRPEFYPLPRPFPELTEWADALDVRDEDKQAMAPGALLEFCDEEDRKLSDGVAAARSGFRKRLVSTPGIIATEDKALGCSLTIQHFQVPLNMEARNAFAHLRKFWETPDGWSCAEAVDFWRHAREMAQGFYLVWEPRPPREWLQARKDFFSQVREILTNNRRGIDSMVQAAKAIDAGEYDQRTLNAWRAIRDSFTPNIVPKWLDSSVAEYAFRWMDEGPGIVWVANDAMLEAMREMVGTDAVFSDLGKNEKGVSIEDTKLQSVVASIQANAEGRNLQRWSRNLVLAPPANGAIWEQLLGRTHRDGQQADEVTFEVLCNCVEQWEAFRRAMNDARYIQQTTGQEQKLLFADIVDFPDTLYMSELTGPQWS